MIQIQMILRRTTIIGKDIDQFHLVQAPR